MPFLHIHLIMSLFKQLWLSLTLIMSATFFVSVSLAENHLSNLGNSDYFVNFTTILFVIWVLIGSLGSIAIYTMVRPIHLAIAQAENISQRRFTVFKLPFTTEFRKLIGSMNHLSQRIQRMLDEETHRLTLLQNKLQVDPISNLLNRQTFIERLHSSLNDQDDNKTYGFIAIVRIMRLNEINIILGRTLTDQLIQETAEALNLITENNNYNATLGRLNGTDFGLFITNAVDSELFAAAVKALQQRLEIKFNTPLVLTLGMTNFVSLEPISHIMIRVDNALVMSELNVEHKGFMCPASEFDSLNIGLNDWRIALDAALKTNQLVLNKTPIWDTHNALIHEECHALINLFNKLHGASKIMPWIHRLGWQARLDSIVVETTIISLHERPTPVCINLSAESISSIQFRHTLLTVLSQTPDEILSLLWIDIPEIVSINQLVDFKSFCVSLQRFPCKIGLKHFGLKLKNLSTIHDLGLDYIKLDYSLVLQIEEKSEYRFFIQGICSVARSLGMLVIAPKAQSVTSVDDMMLLGINGFS